MPNRRYNKQVPGFKAGGKVLKPVKPNQKGLKKLPKKVRNKMGYMKKGGRVQWLEKVKLFFEYFQSLPSWFTNLWILVVASIFGIKGTQIFRNGGKK